MTKEEKLENDWKFTGYKFSYEENKHIFEEVDREKFTFPRNPGDRFECPVCNCVRYVRRNDMHRYHVMDNGTEVQDY